VGVGWGGDNGVEAYDWTYLHMLFIVLGVVIDNFQSLRLDVGGRRGALEGSS
jgi:hypothetical protein